MQHRSTGHNVIKPAVFGHPRMRPRACAVGGKQSKGREGGIARPHEMVAASFVAAIAPRNAEACHHGPGIGLVQMRAQHDRRNVASIRGTENTLISKFHVKF